MVSASSQRAKPQTRRKTVGQVERLYAAAMADYSQGRYASAAKTLLGLILLDASQARFFKGVAACMQLTGKFKHAAQGYASAYALDPGDKTLLFHLAQCFVSVGAWQEANEAAQTFLDETAGSEADADIRQLALRIIHSAKHHQCSKEV